MIEFGKRETVAALAVVGMAVVGITGWWVLQQRQQATIADLQPTFSDGTPAETAGPDGMEIPAKGLEEAVPSPSPAASDVPETPPAAKSDLIVVFVSGAVKRPGVYTFKTGARIYHAIRAAGGLKANAQQDALNQADTLRDADQIYIPPRGKTAGRGAASTASGTGVRVEAFRGRIAPPVSLPPPTVTVRPLVIDGAKFSAASTETPRERGRVLGKPPGETVTAAAQTGASEAGEGSLTEEAEPVAAEEAEKPSVRSRGAGGGAISKFKNPGDGVVNINTAGLAELQKLPGVGPSTAQKFLEYRTQIGRFASIEQVQDIKGIGPKKFAKLRPFMTL